MDFLAKHYEKLVLGFSLLLLIGGILLVANSIGTRQLEFKNVFEDAQRKVNGNNLLPPIDATVFVRPEEVLYDQRVNFAFAGSPTLAAKGSLLEPKRYIFCKNQKCEFFLPFNTDDCPLCRTKQEPVGKEPEPGDDTDADGIPDIVENKYDFLHYLDPDDARLDYDNDGFLNVEEYTHKTALDDADDFPPLAVILRRLQVYKRSIPFKLRAVRKLDTTVKEDWKLEFVALNNARLNPPTYKLGESVAGYKITTVNDEGTEVVVNAPTGETYAMRRDAVVNEEQTSARMVFLYSRQREHYIGLLRRSLIDRRIGEEFELKKQKGETMYSEFYRLLPVKENDVISVALLDAAGGAVQKEFEVPILDSKKDFLSTAAAGGGEMTPGGMPGR